MWSSVCYLALAIHAVNLPAVGAVNINNARDSSSDTDYTSPQVFPSPSITGAGSWAAAFQKAQALVGQMTLEEKVNITYGQGSNSNACVGSTGSVPRLGWPGLCLQDAGNGVRAVDFVNSYPSGLHVGAAWDSEAAYQRGLMMGQEFRTKGVNVALGPVAAPLGRVALGGRNWEGFAVDPYLSGYLTARTVAGMQDSGVITSLKHFVAYEQETDRMPSGNNQSISSNLDDKTMHEIYLWPFVDGIRAGTGSVMCSYNRVNNTYACENSKTLNGLLKGELDFQGFVVSDWAGQHSGVASANAGLDMTMPDAGFWGTELVTMVQNGSVSEDRITDMATRIISAWYQMGQDGPTQPPPGVGVQDMGSPHTIVDARSPDSVPVRLAGAIAGHVLVKNENNTLPLTKPAMLSIFGYDATAPLTKNFDLTFQLGLESVVGNGPIGPVGTQVNPPTAMGGTIISGGGSGATAPAYIDAPFDALKTRSRQDGTYLAWDFASGTPSVDPASDACLVFINTWANEGNDRTILSDSYSDSLVTSVASSCPNTIVVIHTVGIRLLDPWITNPNVTAVVLAHLPGSDSGSALVQLLYGDQSPSGRLPYTIPKQISDYPVVYPDVPRAGNLESPQSNFTEGSYIDYRAFDEKNIEPRYEFGFGLSYTTFEYSSLNIQMNDAAAGTSDPETAFNQAASLTVEVANTGKVPSPEVAQLYIGIPNSPPKQLRGFDKAMIGSGASVTFVFLLTRRDLSVWDTEQQAWNLQSGEYNVYVGSSSRDIRLTGKINI